MFWTRPALILAIMIAAVIPNSAQARQLRIKAPVISTSATVMRKTVKTFYLLRERTLDERGTEADMEKLITLLVPTAIYEHPVPNVKMTVAQAHEGMTAHLKEGKHAKITLGSIRTGQNFAVVETLLQYEVDGKPIARRGMTIFEFYQGKISRVAEY